MTKEQIHAEIIRIQKEFDSSNAKMGEFCGISGPTYAKCKSDKAEGHSFNMGNLEKLRQNIKEKAQKL